MKLTLGFSPCPNDTFIFDALVNKKIDTQDLEFEVVLEDVQTLNKWARNGKLDISKISYGVLPLVLENYIVLSSGGALGRGVGPLLVTKKSASEEAAIQNSKVVIPGEDTTAHLLFSLAYPDAANKEFTIFSKVENAVLSGEADYGVIIHENRFTYQDKGLHKVVDLGDFWEKETGLPIPLGGIVAKRSLNRNLQLQVDQLIHKSIDYAFRYYPVLSEYVKQHAQEMDEKVMRQHIDLYVNNFSFQLGKLGKNAVNKLLEVYQRSHPKVALTEPVFSN